MLLLEAGLASWAKAGFQWRPWTVELMGPTTGFFGYALASSGANAAMIYAHPTWRNGVPTVARVKRGRIVSTVEAALPARADVSVAVGPEGMLRLFYPGLGCDGGWWLASLQSQGLVAEQVLQEDSREAIGTLSLGPNGDPHMIVVDARGGCGTTLIAGPADRTRYVYHTDSGWQVRTLFDSSWSTAVAGGLGVPSFQSKPVNNRSVSWPAIGLGRDGAPVIAHFISLNNVVRLNVGGPPDWTFVEVDTWPLIQPRDWGAAVLVDRTGVPHVFTTHEEPAPGGFQLRHIVKRAWKSNGIWLREVIHTWDGGPAVMRVVAGERADGAMQIVVSWKDLEAWPFISTSAQGQWLCTRNGASWMCQPIGYPEADTLAASAAGLDADGGLHVLYVTRSGQIKYANTSGAEDAMLLPIVGAKAASLVAANNYFSPSAVGQANYTRFYYKVATPGRVRVKVYTTDGTLVGTLVDEEKGAGTFGVDWGGRDETGAVVGTGLYMAELEAPGVREVKKIVVVK